MKKYLILIFSLICILFCGCTENQSFNHPSSPVDTPEVSEPVSVSENSETESVPEQKTESTSPTYETESVPEASKPKEPVCSLTVKCDSVLKKLDKLPDGKGKLIPKNGIIFQKENISFREGESVFDVLCRELEKADIQFEYTTNKFLKSKYIKGIGNLYEFDGGASSGWLYTVNGKSPTYGCEQYILKSNDRIEFYYI